MILAFPKESQFPLETFVLCLRNILMFWYCIGIQILIINVKSYN